MHSFVSRRTAFVVVVLTALAAMSGARTGDPVSIYMLAGVAIGVTLIYGAAWGAYHKGRQFVPSFGREDSA